MMQRTTQRAQARVPNPRVWRLGAYSLCVQPRALACAALLLVLALVLAGVALGLGSGGMPAWRLMQVAAAPALATPDERWILGLRVPRVLCAAFVGAALGASGAVFQSISRNALGSPDLIGFTTGAATGALAVIVLQGQSTAGLIAGAVTGGLVTALAVYALAWRGGTVQARRLVLVGIGTGAILHALNGLMLARGRLDHALQANVWLAGTLEARHWTHAGIVMAGVVLFLPPVLLASRRLRLIELGDALATQLGVPVERTRRLMVFCAVMLAAAATGAAGPIAFIALAAPPLARRLVRTPGVPLVNAAALGACLLLAADLLSQAQPYGLHLPVGKITGMLGGIYLLGLLTWAGRARARGAPQA